MAIDLASKYLGARIERSRASRILSGTSLAGLFLLNAGTQTNASIEPIVRSKVVLFRRSDAHAIASYQCNTWEQAVSRLDDLRSSLESTGLAAFCRERELDVAMVRGA